MAIKFVRKFVDTSADPNVPINDTTTVKIQHIKYGTTLGANAIELSTFSSEADSGWRRGDVSLSGSYWVFIDGVRDTDNSPISINAEESTLQHLIYKDVTIIGTYDNKETLTTGSGKLATASFGGSAHFRDTSDLEIFLVPTTGRPVFWDRDSLSVSSNQASFDVWASDAGQGDTVKCDIIILTTAG